MPYDVRGLVAVAVGASRVGGTDQGGLRNEFWHYTTPDAHAVVLAANYFNPAARMLTVGDFIFATVLSGGAVEARCYVVRANTGTVVTVVQQTFTA